MQVAPEVATLLREIEKLRTRVAQLEVELYEMETIENELRHFAADQSDRLIEAGLSAVDR